MRSEMPIHLQFEIGERLPIEACRCHACLEPFHYLISRAWVQGATTGHEHPDLLLGEIFSKNPYHYVPVKED